MRILVVEPDSALARMIHFVLVDSGHQVIVAASAHEALAEGMEREVDAVVLELDLPDKHGFELARDLRECEFHGPMIFLTQPEAIQNMLPSRVGSLDDFVLRPFDPRELVLRLEMVTRRDGQADYQVRGAMLRIGSAELSLREHSFRVEGRPPVQLTPTEMRIIECLMRNHPITVSRDRLIEQTWGYDFAGDDKRLDVYIGRLRKKIERESATPTYIHTMRGVGYAFRAPHQTAPAAEWLMHGEQDGLSLC